MKKRVLTIFVLSLMMLFCTSCGTQNKTELPAAEKESVSGDEKIATYDNVGVNVGVNEDGFYNLMSEMEIHYYDDHISYITVNDPKLLAFQVSSKYKGGVWVMNLEDGQKTINELTAASEALRRAGNDELATAIETAVQRIVDSGPFTQAST